MGKRDETNMNNLHGQEEVKKQQKINKTKDGGGGGVLE